MMRYVGWTIGVAVLAWLVHLTIRDGWSENIGRGFFMGVLFSALMGSFKEWLVGGSKPVEKPE